jgi:hypothetical protein
MVRGLVVLGLVHVWLRRVGVAQNNVPCWSRNAAGTRRGTPLHGT